MTSGHPETVMLATDLWNWAQEKSSGEYMHYLKQLTMSQKIRKKCGFQIILGGFQLKNHIFLTKPVYHCMSNYGEFLGPKLTFDVKRVLICKFFVKNLPDS